MPPSAARVVGGFRLLFGGLGLISTIAGLASESAIAAMNTLGVVGLGALVVGGLMYVQDDDPNAPENLQSTLGWMASITVIAGVAFVAGTGLDESERQFGVLTIIGIVAGCFFAYMAAVGADVLMKSRSAPQAMSPGEDKACPYCAETIKAAAVRCRYCGSDLPA